MLTLILNVFISFSLLPLVLSFDLFNVNFIRITPVLNEQKQPCKLSSVSQGSVVRCAERCVRIMNCLSFSYDKELQGCILYCEYITEDNDSTRILRRKYYGIRKFCKDSKNVGPQCVVFGHYQINWDEARQHCHRLGHRLAVIRNHETLMFMQSLSKKFKSATCFWLGGNDISQEGKWIWEHDQTTIAFDDLWAPNEPNNNFRKNEDQDCLSISRWCNWKFDDLFCSRKCHFLCQWGVGLNTLLSHGYW